MLKIFVGSEAASLLDDTTRVAELEDSGSSPE